MITDDEFKIITDWRYFDTFVEELQFFSRLIISILSKDTHKGQMITCFIARSDACLKGVYMLCSNGSYSNSRILYRTQIDLLAHLKHVLVDNNLVEEYRTHTIKEKNDVANYALTVPEDRDDLDKETISGAKDRQKHFREVRDETGIPEWFRPRPDEVLTGDKYRRMIKYGWHFTSRSVVHPLFNTGEIDYQLMIGEVSEQDIHNACCEVMTNVADVHIHLMAMAIATYGKQQLLELPKRCLLAMQRSLATETHAYQDLLLDLVEQCRARSYGPLVNDFG